MKNPPTNPHSGEERLFWKYEISGNTVTTKGKMSHKKKRKNEAGIFFYSHKDRHRERQSQRFKSDPSMSVCLLLAGKALACNSAISEKGR